MQKINFQNLPNTTTPINATNLNAIQSNAETAINSVSTELTGAIDMYNNTSGANWKTMMKNKLDYCISNFSTSKTNAEIFINGGWDGVNFGCGIFSKIGTNYQLIWFSSFGTYYCLKTSNGYTYEILGGSIYWNNEKVVGTWIDGKPIYRAVITGTTPSNSSPTSIGSITNKDTIIKLDGYLKVGVQTIPLNFVYNNEQNALYEEANNIMVRTTASSYQSKSCFAIVEYTKTTD